MNHSPQPARLEKIEVNPWDNSKYWLVVMPSMENLVEEVNTFVGKGWKVSGGHQITYDHYQKGYMYSQAIKR